MPRRDELRELASEVDEAGKTPLHLATKTNYTSVTLLLEQLLLGLAANKDGFTALDTLEVSRETAPKEFMAIFSTLMNTSVLFPCQYKLMLMGLNNLSQYLFIVNEL